MAEKLFTLGYEIKLRGLSNVLSGLTKLHSHMEAINRSAEAGAATRKYAENLGMMGAGALAAGGALAGAVAATVGPAMKAQAEWAHVATAMNDGADTMRHLNEVQEVTEKLAANGVIGVEQLGQAYYIARSNMLNHADALEAVAAAQNLVTGTTLNAADASARMESTTRTLTTLVENFGGSLGGYADQLAKLQSQYSFKDIGEVTNALQYAMPAAKGAGVAVEQMNAALALLSAGGLHGPEAGTAFQEFVSKLTTDNKLLPLVARTRQGGLDLVGTLGNLKAAFGNLSPLERARELKSLGFGERDIRGVDIMMDKVGQFGAVEKDLANSQGAAAKLAAIRMGAADEQLANLTNNLDLLRETIGDTLLPFINRLLPRLTSGLQTLVGWAHAHTRIVRLAMEFAAIGAAILIPLGSLALFGASLAFIGSYLPMLGTLLSVFRLWSVATKAATAAQWLLNAAMDANPVVLAIAGIAALGVAVYELIEHWGAIKTFFEKLIPQAFTWGANLLKTFAKGIESAVLWPVNAIERVFSKVARFIPHSPAKEGPLRNLDRVRIVETIADTIKPAPMIHAIRRVAMAAAVAAPMMIGTAAGPAIASSSAAQRSSGGVTMNYAPHVELQVIGGDAAAIKKIVLDALREHKDEVERLLASVRERKERLSF